MSRLLKRLSLHLNGSKSSKTTSISQNPNTSQLAISSGSDQQSFSSSSQTTPAEQYSDESIDTSQPETDETELYDLNSEPHGLFILYPGPGKSHQERDIQVEYV